MSTTVTVRQLRHDLKSVEQALDKGPVKVTKRGKIVWTITPAKKPAPASKWTPPDFTARSKKILGDRVDTFDARDFIG
jgi:antitoxin (DNA-binding transcriptional repressor) of toxin-antitoxin stability system